MCVACLSGAFHYREKGIQILKKSACVNLVLLDQGFSTGGPWRDFKWAMVINTFADRDFIVCINIAQSGFTTIMRNLLP